MEFAENLMCIYILHTSKTTSTKMKVRGGGSGHDYVIFCSEGG